MKSDVVSDLITDFFRCNILKNNNKVILVGERGIGLRCLVLLVFSGNEICY